MQTVYDSYKKLLIILILPVIGLLFFLFINSSSASINQEINFQGKIVNKTDGTNLVNGTPACVKVAGDTCDFQVRIYSDPSGGTPLWTETFTDIELGAYGGVFNLSIGSYCITSQGGSWTSDGDGGSNRCTVSNGGITWGFDPTLYIEIKFDTTDTVGLNAFTTPETFSRKLLTTVPSAFSSTYAQNLVVSLTNNSGGTLNSGTLVISDVSQDSSFTTTTTSNDIRVMGVLVTNNCTNGAVCQVQVAGSTTVNAETGITRGEYLYSSAQVGKVKGETVQSGNGFIGTALSNEAAGQVTILINTSASGGSAATTGSGFSTVQEESLAPGEYIEVQHNLNSNDISTQSWIYDPSSGQYRLISGDSSGFDSFISTDAGIGGYWRLEESSSPFADNSFNVNSLFNGPNSNPLLGQVGKYGKGIDLNGQNDFLYTFDQTYYNPTSLSIGGWFKLEDEFSRNSNINGEDAVLIDKGDYILKLNNQTGKAEFIINDSNTTANTFNVSFDQAFSDRVVALQEFNGHLYSGHGSAAGDGDIFICDPASSGNADLCEAADWVLSYNSATYEYIFSLTPYNGKLYASTAISVGDGDVLVCDPTITGDLIKCDQGDWSIAFDGAQEMMYQLAEFNGYLYGGQGNTAGDSDLYICDPTLTGSATDCNTGDWSVSFDGANTVIRGINQFQDRLYMGPDGTGGDVYMCNPALTGNTSKCDTGDWTISFANTAYNGITTFAEFNGYFYVGFDFAAGDQDVYVCNPSLTGAANECDQADWSLSYNGAQESVTALTVFNGMLLQGIGLTAAADSDVYACRAATTGDKLLCESGDWSLLLDGALDQIDSLYEYKGRLYIGTGVGAGDGNTYYYEEALVLESTAVTWAADTWYHIVGVYDPVASEMRMYVNGVETNSRSTSTIVSLQDSTTNVKIGSGFSRGEGQIGSFFDGKIDEVFIAGRVLSDSDILQVYNSSTSSYPVVQVNNNTVRLYNLGSTTEVLKLIIGPGAGASNSNTFENEENVANNSYLEINHFVGSTSLQAIAYVKQGDLYKVIDVSANLDAGNGSDGNLAPSGTFNLNTDTTGSRSYADGIAYRVTPPESGDTVISRQSTSFNLNNGIAAGDEVLIINLQGASGDITDVGNYEIRTVTASSSGSITVGTPLRYSYNGTTPSSQKVVIQRVPNYANVTLDGTDKLTASDWDGLVTLPTGDSGFYTGIVAFKASGVVSVGSTASIDTTELGYRGGDCGTCANTVAGSQGESRVGLGGTSTSASDNGGGGAPGTDAVGGSAGAGGGYGTVGGNSTNNGAAAATGGSTIGDNQLNQVFFGGGGGGPGDNNGTFGKGGDGGGIILIYTNGITGSGIIQSLGENGDNEVGSTGQGGGGAGGAVLIHSRNTESGLDVNASGGNGGTGDDTAGAGGDGRIAVYFVSQNLSTYDPSPYEEILGGAFFEIVNPNINTTRLFNFSGEPRVLKLVLSTGGGGGGAAVNANQFIKFRPETVQESGDTTNPLVYLNENGTGSANLIQLQVGGIDTFVVDNTGDLTIAGGDITGANGINIDLGETNSGAVTINGNLLPSVNNTYDLGSSSLRWKDGYFGGAVHIGSGSLILTDDYIRDTNGDLVLQSNNDDDDFIYLSQTTLSGANTPGIFWSGVQNYTNDPGIRVNPITGKLEFRDNDQDSWSQFDNFLSISNEYTFSGTTTVGTPDEQVDFTVYGDVITGGNTKTNEAIVTGGSSNTAMFVYNTFLDTDTGAWRTSTASKNSSWYGETKDDTSVTCSESSHDRCGRSEFPSIVSIIATTTDLYFMDSTRDTMWMKFDLTNTYPIPLTTINEIFAKDGKVYLASNAGLYVIDFKNDNFIRYDVTGNHSNGNNILNRNSASTYTLVNDAFQLASTTVNDVDVTEINDVVYIAVGTSLGAQIIDTSYEDTYTYVAVGGATGTATADDETVGSGPWDAFDISNTGQYLSLAVDSTAVLTYQFVQPTRVDRYIITCGAVVGRCPEDWVLQGSNDGTFTDNAGGPFVLDTRGPITMAIETAYTYDVASPGTYNYIRFNITDVLTANPTNNNVNIRNIDLQYRKKTPAVETYGRESTLESLVVSSQLNDAANSWRRLVDHHQNNFYVSFTGDLTPVFQARLRKPTVLTQYSVTGYDLTTYTATSAIRNWLFQGSNDGANWTTLDTQTAQTFAGEFERKTYTFSNTTSYKYARLRVTANNGHATNTTLREFEVQGPVITASSQANATTASAQNLAFQGEDDANYTWQGTAATNEWVKYDYGSQNAPVTTSYSLNLDSTAANVPNAWLFQGSNVASPNTGRNHSDWTTLDTRSVTLSAINRHTFTFSNSTGYRHYRIFIDTTQGAVVPQIAGLEIAEERIVTYQENIAALEEYRISDNDTATDWRSEDLINKETGINAYVEKDFGAGNQRVVTAMMLDIRALTNVDPTDWVLYGSNDRSTWTTLASDVDHAVVATKSYIIDNQTAYRYYRLTIFATATLANGALIDEWDLVVGQTPEVEFGNNGDLYITDEENQKLLAFRTTQNNTAVFDITPNQQLDIQNMVGINEPPKSAISSLNYTNSKIYYGGQHGLDVYEYSPTKAAIERVKRLDNSVIGDFTTLFTFDGGVIATPGTVETVRETSGNKAFVTKVNGSPDFVAGKVNDTALDFDNATDDHIIVPDEQFDSFANEFSAGAWINNDATDAAATNQSIMGTYVAASNGWFFYLETTTRELKFYNGATAYASTYIVTPGEWVHVAVTFKTGILKFYVNGAVVFEIEANNTTDGGDFYIGGRGVGAITTTDYDGYIDDVFTNDKLLTQEEIQDIMKRSENWYIDGTQATSGNSTSITANGAGFTPNDFQNQLIEIVSGAGAGQSRTVTSNTASIINITPNWSVNPDATSVFKIREFSLPGIEEVRSVSTGDSQTLIGTNNGADGGGAIFYTNIDSRYRINEVNYYHGASGKLDTGGNIWKTTYDDILGIESVNNKLHILSDKHYWVESLAESLKEKVEQLEQNALNVVDSTGTTQSRQVIRTGWGFIEGNATAAIQQIVDFGINFTSPPTVLTTGIGYNTTSPDTISECSLTTFEQLTHAQILNNASFTLLMRRVVDASVFAANQYFCYNWVAIGEFEGGGADLAENYFTRDLTLEAGDVIGIDYLNDISVVKTTKPYDVSAIGIVATQPDIVLGPPDGTTPGVPTSITGDEVAQGSGKVVPVALAGRVPVKVTLENGPIKRGDFLTPASKPGYAMKATKPGITIGRAMENFDGSLTVIDTDKTLAELDKLIELGEIDLKANEIISKLERDENGNLNPDQESALGELAALKLSSSLSQPEGKVMTFVQTGYYWGESNDSQTQIPTATQEESVNDNVQNTDVEESDEPTELDEDSLGEVDLDEDLDFDITDYITPQPDDANIGSFTLGRLIIRQESNSINSVGDKLRFQTISDEPIEFYGGSILFDKFGNIITLGSIRADSIFVNQIFIDKATGEAIIQAGAQDIYIENPYVSEDSTIFITSDKFITYRIKSVDAGKGFHVELSSPPDEEVRIKYLFIN